MPHALAERPAWGMEELSLPDRADMRVRDLIGIPFVRGGRDPQRGMDCQGLVMAALARWGCDVPDYDPGVYDARSIDAVYCALALKSGLDDDGAAPGNGLRRRNRGIWWRCASIRRIPPR